MTSATTHAEPGLDSIMEDMAVIVDAIQPDFQRLSGKTILITGANGFLPSYIADAIAYGNEHQLLREPARLLLLVRSPIGKHSRLAHLVDRENVAIIVQDVSTPLQLVEPVHFIVHAASLASPKWYRANPVGAIDANSVALRQLLELGRQTDTESVLFFSSSEVYGNPDHDNIPTPESYPGRVSFTGLRSCYAEAKRFGETLCTAFYEQYGVPVKSVRPFHIHGPGLRIDDVRIVADLVSQGLRGKPFELMSDGQSQRTYGYVSDATIGFLKVLLSDYNGQAFNVGADAPETSVLELATIVADIFGSTDPVKVGVAPRTEYHRDAPDRVCPDLSKIRRLLHYSPSISLYAGLQRTIHWHRLREVQART